MRTHDFEDRQVWWLKHSEEVSFEQDVEITDVMVDWPDARPEQAIPPATFLEMLTELKTKVFATLYVDGKRVLQGPVGGFPWMPGLYAGHELKAPLAIKPDTKIRADFEVAGNCELLHGANLSQLDFIIFEKKR